jgi:hypothetical protein
MPEEEDAGLATPSDRPHERAHERHDRAAAAATSVGLRALVGTPDSRVLAGFASGHLKCFSSLGRLLWKKVTTVFAPLH